MVLLNKNSVITALAPNNLRSRIMDNENKNSAVKIIEDAIRRDPVKYGGWVGMIFNIESGFKYVSVHDTMTFINQLIEDLENGAG